MVGLPDGEKNFEDMYNRLNSIPACDRGRTDRQTDILPQHSPRYAYASRGKYEPILKQIGTSDGPQGKSMKW